MHLALPDPPTQCNTMRLCSKIHEKTFTIDTVNIEIERYTSRYCTYVFTLCNTQCIPRMCTAYIFSQTCFCTAAQWFHPTCQGPALALWWKCMLHQLCHKVYAFYSIARQAERLQNTNEALVWCPCQPQKHPGAECWHLSVRRIISFQVNHLLSTLSYQVWLWAR